MNVTEPGLDELIDRDQRAIACPYPIFAELRDTSPVHYSDKLGAWVCTGYDDIKAVLHDTERFSSLMPTGPSRLPDILADAMAKLSSDPSMAEIFDKTMDNRGQAAVLLNADPPDHRRQRLAVNTAFRPARLRGMEPLIESVASRMLDGVIAADRFEVVGDFAVGLPMTIIAKALGVDDDDLAQFKRWSDDLVMPVGNHDPSVEQVRSYLISNVEFTEFFTAMLKQRRAEPRDDIISDVAGAEVDGVELSTAEQLSMLQQFLVAGNETTTKLLTNIVHHLATDDGLEQLLRDDPARIDLCVEEALRFEAPVGGLFRQAKVDVALGAQTISKGDHVWLLFAAANRDAAQFPNPDAFEACRSNAREHLAFGHGEHFCIGAQLARSEARIAVEQILARMTNLRLIDNHPPFEYEDTFVLRGLTALHVEFDRI